MRYATEFDQQKGQTLLLVAFSMVAFVAMGALAIDLTSLYSAHSEIQRAADATALAGAKAFVDSGVTTNPGNATLLTIATKMANAYAAAAAVQNLVAGSPAQVVTVSPNFKSDGNPTITVKLQRTNLSLFFSRIWAGNFGNVSATAVAEAYNPGANPLSSSGSLPPSAPKCTKPISITNIDPQSRQPFVNVTTGLIKSSVIGEQINDISMACQPGGNVCALPVGRNGQPIVPGPRQYLPMQVSVQRPPYSPSPSAPGCGNINSPFELNIAGCDGIAFSAPQCGTGTIAQWDSALNPGAPNTSTTSALQCLIHTASGTTQDSLDPSAFTSGTGPLLIQPGIFSQARYTGVASTDFISTSDSIITVPLFDTTTFNPQNSKLNIVGFLTLFVDKVGNQSRGTFTATVLNVTGCGPSTAVPISGGGVSAIPVRLIHN